MSSFFHIFVGHLHLLFCEVSLVIFCPLSFWIIFSISLCKSSYSFTNICFHFYHLSMNFVCLFTFYFTVFGFLVLAKKFLWIPNYTFNLIYFLTRFHGLITYVFNILEFIWGYLIMWRSIFCIFQMDWQLCQDC